MMSYGNVRNALCFGIAALAIFVLFTGCGSFPGFGGGGGGSGGGRASAKSLDVALHEAADLIDSRVKVGTKIALINFNSPSERLSDYCLSELEANILDFGNLTIVDRKQIDLIRGELQFQMSGEVSDKSMQEMGAMLGAEHIVSGTMTEVDEVYRMVIRVLVVQSAAVAAQYRVDIANDARFQAVSGYRGEAVATAQQAAEAEKRSKEAEKQAQAEFVANHPMRFMRLGFAVHGGPSLGGGKETMVVPIFVMGELGFGAFDIDMGFAFFPGANDKTLIANNAAKYPSTTGDDSSSSSSDISFTGFCIGLSYTVFGNRWLLNIGPGIYIISVESHSLVVPYGQLRYDYRLNGYDIGVGVYLRLGFRLDINPKEMYQDGDKYVRFYGEDFKPKASPFPTYNIFAGMAFTIP